MTYGTHLGVGLVAVGGLVPVLAPRVGLPAALLFGAMLAVGSIFPDVDAPTTAASRRHPVLRLLYLLTLGPVSLLAVRLRGHRTLTHSLFGIVLSGAVFGAVAWAVYPILLAHVPVAWPTRELWTGAAAAGVLLGTWLHVVAMDGLTVSGVPLGLPWTTRPYHVLPAFLRVKMETGYFRERKG